MSAWDELATTELRPPRGEEIPNNPTLPVLVYHGLDALHAGPAAAEELVTAVGDALVLPAGTGHKRLESSDDFLVVGSYPPGQEDYDMRYGDPAERDEVERNIAAVALPPGDPFGGPLAEAWGL